MWIPRQECMSHARLAFQRSPLKFISTRHPSAGCADVETSPSPVLLQATGGIQDPRGAYVLLRC